MGAVLPRNFDLPLAERLRALASGPPSFARRLRRIEELEAAIVRALAEIEAKGEVIDPGAPPEEVAADMARLVRLVADHNRYYPVEACLPIDVRTHELMDWGEPWSPMPAPSLEVLLTRARAA